MQVTSKVTKKKIINDIKEQVKLKFKETKRFKDIEQALRTCDKTSLLNEVEQLTGGMITDDKKTLLNVLFDCKNKDWIGSIQSCKGKGLRMFGKDKTQKELDLMNILHMDCTSSDQNDKNDDDNSDEFLSDDLSDESSSSSVDSSDSDTGDDNVIESTSQPEENDSKKNQEAQERKQALANKLRPTRTDTTNTMDYYKVLGFNSEDEFNNWADMHGIQDIQNTFKTKNSQSKNTTLKEEFHKANPDITQLSKKCKKDDLKTKINEIVGERTNLRDVLFGDICGKKENICEKPMLELPSAKTKRRKNREVIKTLLGCAQRNSKESP